MRYIIYSDDGWTALRVRDGRIILSDKRMTLFTRREAEKAAQQIEKGGRRTVRLPATRDEIAWAQGGRRLGSDWSPN